MKTSRLLLFFSVGLLLFGCAGAKKAQLASGSTPAAAVSEVARLMQQSQQEQVDLLAFDEYMAGSRFLERARQGLSQKYDDEVILSNAAIAKAHFQRARALSSARRNNATRILQARKSALDAGLRDSAPLVTALLDVDDDLRDETNDFSRTLEPKEFSEFQKKYFALEIQAVQFRELDGVRRAIQKATDSKAKNLAPNSLRSAMLDLNEAENLIAQSPRNADIHEESVNTAVASAKLLSEVMDVVLNARGTPEPVALKIVQQNRELARLSQDVGSLQENLKTTQSSLLEREGALEQQSDELRKTSAQVRFQQAMDAASRQFSEDEALVYQQGNKLVFRLKSINFPSGKATIPAASRPLLVKANDIIKSLDAELVVVEGHTDSVGASDLNLRLSTARATSVADYLSSLGGGYKIGYVGHGETRPIATNDTEEGRAMNRRVDLVVTAKK